MKKFKNGKVRFDAADIANAWDKEAPLTEGGRALLEAIVATAQPPVTPTENGENTHE